MPAQVLYLTTIGRKTGLLREIEIWFVESGGKYYLLAEKFHEAHWVQNIERNPQVKVRLDGRERPATARVLDPERDRQVWELAQQLGREKYGWGEGLPVEILPESGE
jgi:deazaflavin-dependent oxidoreductase (nitroreductase family)